MESQRKGQGPTPQGPISSLVILVSPKQWVPIPKADWHSWVHSVRDANLSGLRPCPVSFTKESLYTSSHPQNSRVQGSTQHMVPVVSRGHC
jgi:hypothetical protein